MAKKKEDAPTTINGEVAVALKAPKNAGESVSFNGEQYDIVDGEVLVPASAVAELICHGYTEGE